ncbi:MAG: hydrolase TatD [Bacteroidetes bacterium]|nr:MAG: hydrolase TatD [Bacteroidota bacterium]
MILFDTHTHIYSEEFNEDRNEVIKRSFDAGVTQLLLPNIDLESIEPMHQLCDKYPDNCFPMMGLHPTSVKKDYKEVLQTIRKELDKRKYIAIGEIGIDLYWDKTFAEEQRIALLEQFQWAIDFNLPVVIHSRDSHNEIMRVIKEFNNPNLRGVFHCFTGSTEQAKEIIDINFMMGLGGVLTFKNSGLSKEIVNIDMQHFILETDSPYLTPTPYRGKRNESSYIKIIAEKLAEVKGISLEEIAQITTENAKRLFVIENENV